MLCQPPGLTTPAALPPRRTGSPAASILPLPSSSRPVATPIVGGISIVGSSEEVLTTAGALQSSAGSGFVFEIDPPAGGAPASPATLPICLPVPDGSTFTVPGNQGETNRSDLLTARKHEPGYPLGLKHTDDRVAVGFLASAAGQVHGANLKADDPALLDQLFAAWPD